MKVVQLPMFCVLLCYCWFYISHSVDDVMLGSESLMQYCHYDHCKTCWTDKRIRSRIENLSLIWQFPCRVDASNRTWHYITASLVPGTTIRYLFSISVLCYFVTNAGLSVKNITLWSAFSFHNVGFSTYFRPC